MYFTHVDDTKYQNCKSLQNTSDTLDDLTWSPYYHRHIRTLTCPIWTTVGVILCAYYVDYCPYHESKRAIIIFYEFKEVLLHISF